MRVLSMDVDCDSTLRISAEPISFLSRWLHGKNKSSARAVFFFFFFFFFFCFFCCLASRRGEKKKESCSTQYTLSRSFRGLLDKVSEKSKEM